jgi:cysteinyl-tRNA synthetase
MSEAFLGEVFDIHGGGIDLVFPHHENELAQSRCAHGTDKMAQIWMHNGYLQVEGAKMSKSAGNFVTMRELLEGLDNKKPTWHGRQLYRGWHPRVIRLAMLGVHYTKPLDWTLERLFESENILDKWVADLDGVDEGPEGVPDEVVDALRDDLNTPVLISILHALQKDHRATKSWQDKLFRLRRFKAALEFLGLYGGESIAEFRRYGASDVNIADDSLQRLVAARAEARKRKDWAEADRIRDELEAMGIALKDSKDPETGELVTTWELKR